MFYQWYQWYTSFVQGSTNGTIGNNICTNGNANGTIGSSNGTIGKPMVQLVKLPMVPLGEPRTEPLLVFGKSCYPVISVKNQIHHRESKPGPMPESKR